MTRTWSDSEKAGSAARDAAACPIVGIGASAGGLAAFEAFFSGMPADADPGIAFVLVQHLAPDHKSILTALVQRYTRMQVFEVEDGMTVRPNCAYIIPPGRDMAFLGGTLQLLEPSAPRGQRMPIDFFFRSLAQDQRERAIGVVLSGTGSDGTLGIRAIKGEGGMVMVQRPASAEYDGMPRSALATGLVDYELPPAEMPARIIAYALHAFAETSRPDAPAPPKAENEVKKALVLLRAHAGHDFSQYKPSTVHRRIARRMAVHQIETMDTYVRYLQQSPAEAEALFRDMLIGVTSFFRDPQTFEALKAQAIPKLFSQKPRGSTLRVWSVGCSTGEEAYSLAILLAEREGALSQSIKIQIFATDIDSHSIATARAGVYPASIAADISSERLARYFSMEPDGGGYRIRKSIRDMIVFSEQNVIKDPPFSKLDLISCRNLLIYMDADLQRRIVPLFHYALSPGGFLFLGTSETVGDSTALFATLDRQSKLYQRKEEPHHASLHRLLPSAKEPSAHRSQASPRTAGPRKPSLREVTEQALLRNVAPAAVLVNSTGEVLYLHGRTGLYLEPAPGEAGPGNILTMAREGLRRALSTALRRAVAEQVTVRCRDLQVKTNGGFTPVHLTVSIAATDFAAEASAAASTNAAAPMLLVTLEQPPVAQSCMEIEIEQPVAEAASDAPTEDEPHTLVASLRQELRATEEYLHTANEELETANEELRSSNEEMQSVNEELQSTNEELETSKEELQSVNEELATVNAELQNKVIDLTRSNNDMNNLLAGTGIATVFVDHFLNILRFTPTATRLINLIRSDIGRPVGHIVSNLVDYDALPADTLAVLDTLVPKEADVQTKAGAWYTMRILPYRTLENVIEGVVITFVDITRAKRAQEAFSRFHIQLTERLLGRPEEALLVLDASLRVMAASPAFYALFQVTPAEIRERLLYELGNRPWNLPEVRAYVEGLSVQGGAGSESLIVSDCEAGGRRALRISGCWVGGAEEVRCLVLSLEGAGE